MLIKNANKIVLKLGSTTVVDGKGIFKKKSFIVLNFWSGNKEEPLKQRFFVRGRPYNVKSFDIVEKNAILIL